MGSPIKGVVLLAHGLKRCSCSIDLELAHAPERDTARVFTWSLHTHLLGLSSISKHGSGAATWKVNLPLAEGHSLDQEVTCKGAGSAAKLKHLVRHLWGQVK